MSFKPLFAITLCLFHLQASLHAQGKERSRFTKVTPADFNLPLSPIIDSNTNAVILAHTGETHFVGNNLGWFSYVFTEQIRIKIINKKAFHLATVRLWLYGKEEEDDKDIVDKLSASTYNLENGNVVETRLGKNDVFDEKIDKDHSQKRFTLPGVKEGSIIEYSYTKTSHYNFNLPSWEFQSENYPCLWSEYEVNIPQLLFYTMIRQGIHEYFIDKGSEGNDSYRLIRKVDHGLVSTDEDQTVTANTIKHHWAMKDIPAFHVENYISNPQNYIDKIEFQLARTYSGVEARDVTNHMNTWAKATEELLNRENFGKLITEDNGWLDDLLNEITGHISDPLQQAKAIYYYVNSHFTCTNRYRPIITTRLQDVVQKRNGTVGDLNLLLIAMLRRAHIPAEPVLLSTREFGFNPPQYPVMDRLNYMIVRMKIGNQLYYLDAAHQQLGFGQLAGDCYNGHARIIDARDSGSVYFYADSLHDKKTTMVLIVNTDKGGIEGSFQSTADYPGSYDLREKIKLLGEKDFSKASRPLTEKTCK